MKHSMKMLFLPVIMLLQWFMLSPVPAWSAASSIPGIVQSITNDQAPPDSMGAAGPSYLVEIVNGQAVYIHKTTKARTEMTLKVFFGSPTDDDDIELKPYDPRIVYDEATSRFIAISAASQLSSRSFLLITVSNNSDPTAGWEHRKIYAGVPESGGIVGTWLEYPTLGVNKDAIYVAGSMVDDEDNGVRSNSTLL